MKHPDYLHAWLESDNPVLRRHAQALLGRPVEAPLPQPPASPSKGSAAVRLLRHAAHCPYREVKGDCGCSGYRAWCNHADPKGYVNGSDCLRCLQSLMSTPAPHDA